jgi:hypothetical protein
MLKNTSRYWPVMIVSGLLMLSACSKKDEAPVTESPLTDTSGLLRYVPADTPYILSALEPAPDDFMDKMEPKIDKLLGTYRSLLQAVLKQAMEEEAGEELDAEQQAQATAVVNELSTLLSLDGLRGVGMTRESTMVFYGHGLLPVLRISLTDDALFDAAIARIETSAGQSLPVGEVQGKPYRYFEAEEVRIVVATIDDQLVVTLVPRTFGDAELGQLLGLTLPAENLAQTAELQAIADDYGYLAAYVGLISMERLAATFLDEPAGLNAGLMSMIGHESSDVDEVCREEIRSLAAVMPRVVTGYEEISVERVKSSFVAELRGDIAAGLATIPAAVPGLGQTYDGLFSLGMSMNPMALREFLEARIDALEAEPFECTKLAGLQQAVAGGRQALSQPLPPVAYNFRGFLALVKDIQGFDFQKKTPPESIDASFVLAMEDAPGLLAFVQMMSPELAELSIEPDGEPRQFELPATGNGVESAWIVLNQSTLAISVSPNAEQVLPDLLVADSASPPPFMSVDVDAASYYTMLGDAMMHRKKDLDEEMQAAFAEVLLVAVDFYDRISVVVGFTERGVEVSADITLGD